MTLKNSTYDSFYRKLHLVYLVFFNPTQFEKEEEEDNKVRRAQTDCNTMSRIQKIRRGLWQSFKSFVLTVTASVVIGLGLLTFLNHELIYGAVALIFGAGILMWATFAQRGWDIQSMGGVTLSERANQWIFRALFILGTALITIGTVLTIFSSA